MFLTLLLATEVECYAKSSTVLGSRYALSEHEKITDDQLSEYIYNCSLNSGYSSYNWYGAPTTEDNIYQAAYGVGHTFSISFYIGHGYNDKIVWIVEKHYEIITDNGVKVSDDWIFPYSECKNDKFVFLWSCYQGETIGGDHFWSGAYGMPYCWLHTTNLSNNGYDNPDNNSYAFIGFTGPAPYLTLPMEGKSYAGYYFSGYFYQAALQDGASINSALNYAAFKVWNVPYFSDCIFYTGFTLDNETSRMVLYGDGNLQLGSAASLPPPPTAPPSPRPPGGGECPTLFVWNGTEYSEEGALDIHAESDITLQHRIEQPLILDGQVYKLRLRELDNYTSHIDQVKLYAVSEEEQWHPCPLLSVYHTELGYVTWRLRFDDSTRVDLAPTETINLRFVTTTPHEGIAYFVFEINGYNRKLIYA